MRGLAEHHGGEQLATQPCTTPGRHALLDEGDLELGSNLRKLVRTRKRCAAGTHDDYIRLGVDVEILEVARGHRTAHGGLADRHELVVVKGGRRGFDDSTRRRPDGRGRDIHFGGEKLAGGSGHSDLGTVAGRRHCYVDVCRFVLLVS